MADVITTSFFVETPAAIVRPAKPLSQEGRILAALGLLRGRCPGPKRNGCFATMNTLPHTSACPLMPAARKTQG